MFGFVSMMAATSGVSSDFTMSGSTVPSARAGTGFTEKPMRAAVAGLVPWADSGTSTTFRSSPLAAMAALIAIMPQSSPCAPAFGESATASMPVSSSSQWESACISSSAPGTVESGCIGWMSPKPGSRAMRSLRRGLCFMVQEPSGKSPVSIP